MKEFECIGTTPTEEGCVQLDSPNYYREVRVEIKAFTDQLIRVFGEPPPGVVFKTNRNLHDVGVYYDILIAYDDQQEQQLEYVMNMVNNLPENWDKKALVGMQK